jgi:uncharacterized protein YndB with AHSA1/START domain
VITFETDALIGRPPEVVFAYISEPLNFPHWNSAVRTVRQTSGGADGIASTYLMERELPSGHAVNKLELVASEPPRLFVIRATAGPTPFHYRYNLSAENGLTILRLAAEVDLGHATFLGPLARRAVRSGVDANLATLKTILETTSDA